MCILDVDFRRKDSGTCWEGAAGKASPEAQREVPEEAGLACRRSSDPPHVHTPFQVCALPLETLKDSVAVLARGDGTGASPAKELFGPSALRPGSEAPERWLPWGVLLLHFFMAERVT